MNSFAFTLFVGQADGGACSDHDIVDTKYTVHLRIPIGSGGGRSVGRVDRVPSTLYGDGYSVGSSATPQRIHPANQPQRHLGQHCPRILLAHGHWWDELREYAN